ncbi:ImmA/IrrE family metallo-endopeptidase [Rothia nasimurium]|uniref:ImmA/IrrE family metallo-endopeptidase n=1 Tax=Rothia nasimurium TaxID=85336 RepID=UPI001F416AC0|nr:ImmA/IrrE family metallo-endopeptidase [Rothia nasimurium]
MYDPYQHAHELGVTIIHTNPGPGLNGLYTGKHNGAPTIHLRPGLTTREERSVLAHELVHVEHDDQPTADHAWSARRERRCDRIAAQRLINRDHLIQLAATYPDKGVWAIELGVTGYLLDTYLTTWPITLTYSKHAA